MTRPRDTWRERTAPPGCAAAPDAVAEALRERAKTPASSASAAHIRMLANLAAARGIAPDRIQAYLSPGFKHLPDPRDIPGMDEAAHEIAKTMEAGGKIVVFGDYDVDGVCATAILVRLLTVCGARVAPFIPKRKEEGYGLTKAAMDRMLRENPGVKLLVTVDNGISSIAEVEYLRSAGVGTIVTDHHTPGGELPRADVLVNPRVKSDPAGKADWLCGAGVAFMLAARTAAIARERGMLPPDGAKLGGPATVLAGLATVADIVPLSGANRVIVHQALRLFQNHAPAGLKELLHRSARRAPDRLSTVDFGFQLAPRLNACGRIADAMQAYDLVMCDFGKNDDDARETARSNALLIDALNARRRTIEEKMLATAAKKIPEGAEAAFTAVFAEDPLDPEGPNPGVAGIVAARLCETLGVPCAVAVKREGVAHGSARAPDGYDVHAALSACSSDLERFGGHAGAGGFTLAADRMDDFAAHFKSACAAQNAAGIETARFFDGWIDDIRHFDLEWLELQSLLEPFGEGNPEPVFGIRDAVVVKTCPVGADGKHLSLEFKTPKSRSSHRAVWWRHGADVEEIRGRGSAPCAIFARPFRSDYDPLAPSVEWDVRSIEPLV